MQVKSLFRTAWEDEREPEKGFKYIYLTPDDYARLAPLNSVKATLIEDNGESRYQITDIIGKEEGFGVENLKHAGMIAGETSRAYNEVITKPMTKTMHLDSTDIIIINIIYCFRL